MKRMVAPLALMLMAAPMPLAAETGAEEVVAEALTDSDAIGDAAQEAADRLDDAKDRLLASEMIGRKVTGPDGDELGEVEDLVVAPGGQVVAVLVKPDEGDRVALPYRALKVSAAASASEEMGLSLPVDLDEARGIDGMQALTDAVTGEDG